MTSVCTITYPNRYPSKKVCAAATGSQMDPKKCHPLLLRQPGTTLSRGLMVAGSQGRLVQMEFYSTIVPIDVFCGVHVMKILNLYTKRNRKPNFHEFCYSGRINLQFAWVFFRIKYKNKITVKFLKFKNNYLTGFPIYRLFVCKCGRKLLKNDWKTTRMDRFSGISKLFKPTLIISRQQIIIK